MTWPFANHDFAICKRRILHFQNKTSSFTKQDNAICKTRLHHLQPKNCTSNNKKTYITQKITKSLISKIYLTYIHKN